MAKMLLVPPQLQKTSQQLGNNWETKHDFVQQFRTMCWWAYSSTHDYIIKMKTVYSLIYCIHNVK